MDVSQGNSSMNSLNDDSLCSFTKPGTAKKNIGGGIKLEDDRDRNSFYKDLYQFHDHKGYFFFVFQN